MAMVKRLLMATGALLVINFIGLLIFGVFMKHGPEPSKGEVEALAHLYDLEEFGPVEGSLLYTPNNWGFFNGYTIVVVEQALGQGEQYADQYVLIKAGEKLAANEKEKIEESLSGLNAEVHSKHRLQVYKEDGKVAEAWYYKAIFISGNEPYLSFIPFDAVDGEGFNFAEEGYSYFKDF